MRHNREKRTDRPRLCNYGAFTDSCVYGVIITVLCNKCFIEQLTRAPQCRLRVLTRKMSGSHVLISTDWGLLPTRWAAHTYSSAQTEGCYPQDEWLTRAHQYRLRVVTREMSSSHVLLSADWGFLPTRWVAHTYSSAQTEGCYPQDEWLTCAHQHRLRVVTHKMSGSHILISTDWGLLPVRWVAHMCSSAQTEGCYLQDEWVTHTHQHRLRVVTRTITWVPRGWGHLIPKNMNSSCNIEFKV